MPTKSDFMSLDKFQIPPRLICELYKDSLIVLDDKQSKPEMLNEKKVYFLGDNLKNILIQLALCILQKK